MGERNRSGACTGGVSETGDEKRRVQNPEWILGLCDHGIWQSVWMEYVPDHYIEAVNLKPDPDDKCLEIWVMMNDEHQLPVDLTVLLKDEVIAQAEGMTGDTCKVELPSCSLWSPEEPVLYDIAVRAGEDEVVSYFAMRKISMERDSKGMLRLFLN